MQTDKSLDPVSLRPERLRNHSVALFHKPLLIVHKNGRIRAQESLSQDAYVEIFSFLELCCHMKQEQ